MKIQDAWRRVTQSIVNRNNPFFQTWRTPFATPPFDRIKPEHFMPAFEYGIAEEKSEIAAIAANPAPATFENTIVPFEKVGQFFERAENVFYCLTGAATTEELKALEVKVSSLVEQRGDEIYQDQELFRKVEAVHNNREMLSEAQSRVVHKRYLDFLMAGAHLPDDARSEIRAINARVGLLAVKFGQNVQGDEEAFALPLVSEEDKKGLSAAYLDAAARTSAERGLPHPVATLGTSRVEAFLTESARPDLRDIVYKAHKARGANDNAFNNTSIIEEVTQLRSRYAEILGFDSFAHLQLQSTMTGTPEGVHKLHDAMWPLARRALMRDKVVIEDLARADGIERLKASDWLYYANKMRERDYAVDETKLADYFPLSQSLKAMFYIANRVFGLWFTEKKDIPVYHPDVRAWEVTDREGQHVAVFYGDFFARPGKESGAWATTFRGFDALAASNSTPLVYSACNFAKPTEGKPALLGREDALTLFHEFGHSLHEMLSTAPYPSLAGMRVAEELLEVPSQLFERLGMEVMLTRFARHWQTDEPLPQDMCEKIRKAQKFNKPHEAAGYLAASALDMEWHSLRKGKGASVEDIEQIVQQKLNIPDIVDPWHKSTHFAHIVDDYAAAYYTYMAADVMAADMSEACCEEDIFSPEIGERLRAFYSAGDSKDPVRLFFEFRGRDPDMGALLKHYGFSDAHPERRKAEETHVADRRLAL